MVKKPVPSLSNAGWLNEIQDKADKLLSYYLTTEYSQTHIYMDKVVSLAYHIAHYFKSPLDLRQKMTQDLEAYFGRYFEKCLVDIQIVEMEESNSRLDIQLEIFVTEDGKTYSVGKEVKSLNGKVAEISNGKFG